MKGIADPHTQSSTEILPALEEILSVFRHHLGNSVNALKVTLDVLEQNFDSFDEDKKKEYLRRASGILERQQVMLEAMKSYSHTNVNEHRAVDFLPFWEQWLDAAKERIEKERVTLTHRVETGSCVFSGDPLALRTALNEILGNALEAMEGAQDRRIELGAERQDDEILITIKDSGCGIREEEISKAFIPLFTTKPGRKGLGLSIALKLLAQMGGRLEVGPLSGTGALFRVCLNAGCGNHEKALQD